MSRISNIFKKLQVDLLVMAYVTDIVPLEIIESPSYGTIQYHPSLLPKHRGPSSINWAIINGDAKTGITIFWPDKGLDTGPILLQKEVEINNEELPILDGSSKGFTVIMKKAGIKDQKKKKNTFKI